MWRWIALLLFAGLAALPALAQEDDDEAAAFPDILDYYDSANVGPQPDGRVVVATNQVLDPFGLQVQFPGRPNDCAFSPDGSLVAVADAWGGLVRFIDPATGEIRSQVKLPNEMPGYSGVTFSPDGQRLWVSGSRNVIFVLERNAEGAYELKDPIDVGESVTPVGISLSADASRLYVCLNRKNQVAVLDAATGETLSTVDVGVAPFAALEGPGGTLYVTNWGGRRATEGDVTEPTGNAGPVVVDPRTHVASLGSVSVIDLATGTEAAQIATGLHPCEMALSPDGATLYVACANSDQISVIDTARNAVARTIDVKPLPELPFGSAPNALALAPDGATLYVSLGTNNAIAVLATDEDRAVGYIPVGWYPGGLDLSPATGTLAVCNIKGIGSRDPRDPKGFNSHHYLGSLSLVPTEDAAGEREALTQRTLTNNRMTATLTALGPARADAPPLALPERHGEPSRIKHVIYIIKENKTYDQVLGDMAEGNGDPKLCIYPEEVTPNHHALAREFALLDNFYCCGTLSADGHQWTDSGYATDYIEKGFRGWPRSYPYDGNDAMAYAPGGFLWDNARAHGKSVRIYGEFVGAKLQEGATWADYYRDYLNGTSETSVAAVPKIASIADILCPTYVGFPLTVPEVYRAREFLREFHANVAAGSLPDLMILLMPVDHTSGSKTLPTLNAQLADNDLALGQVVDAVSHSAVWDETAIFVTEDDPQSALDHVDGRRTLGYVISPYTPRGAVVSTNYNQTSMLKTMELILGLPPMTQFDLLASPMRACFTEDRDSTPYSVRPNNIPLDQMPEQAAALDSRLAGWWELYCSLDYSQEDLCDETALNLCQWHLLRGPDEPYPVGRYGRPDQIEDYEEFVEAHPELFEPAA